MSSALPWDQASSIDGVMVIPLSTWRQFTEFASDVLLDRRNYDWRGQASENWLLEPTLDRLLKSKGQVAAQDKRDHHLQNFKYAARGRRGPNPTNISTENDWWALGQHFGLATPLLDWTHSPYVAAYFAFVSKSIPGVSNRAIFALSTTGVSRANAEIQSRHIGPSPIPLIEFVRPLSDENARLVNQGGLFTRAPDGVDIESWVRKHSKTKQKATLVKVTVPDGERERCLKELNRMNINHLSLFPDLYGASRYCNFDLEIDLY